jgi:Putative auto-transporter adhesin, head GIN domain
MKKFLLSTAALAIFTFLGSCDWEGIRGNGHVVNDQRAVEEFAELHTSGGAFDIDWRSGAPALTIRTDENLLPYIEARKIGNQLELRTRRRVHSRHGIKVVVASSTRSGAKLSGASELKAPGLAGDKFALQSSGIAEVTLDGAVDKLLVDMTGASDLKAKSLQARSVEISTTGAGSAQVAATELLRVAITGAGDITYFGNPKTVEKHVTGAGSIRHKE